MLALRQPPLRIVGVGDGLGGVSIEEKGNNTEISVVSLSIYIFLCCDDTLIDRSVRHLDSGDTLAITPKCAVTHAADVNSLARRIYGEQFCEHRLATCGTGVYDPAGQSCAGRTGCSRTALLEEGSTGVGGQNIGNASDISRARPCRYR